MDVCVLGSLNLDVVCRVAELPRPGETLACLGVERLPGGKGVNQAVAAARSGARTTMIGAVGRDAAGEMMLAALDAAGVGAGSVARLDGHATGEAFVWVSAAGENSIVVAGGANMALRPQDIDAAALDGRRVFLAQLETPLAVIEALFEAPPARSGMRILNAAPALTEATRLLPLTDILIVNETELAGFAGTATAPQRHEDIIQSSRRLISRPGQRVVVTLGKAGAIAIDAIGALVVEGRPARVVDTTGAGDCFCGALAARLSVGESLERALAWANTAASLSTECPGACPSMPSAAEIARALQA